MRGTPLLKGRWWKEWVEVEHNVEVKFGESHSGEHGSGVKHIYLTQLRAKWPEVSGRTIQLNKPLVFFRELLCEF